MSNDSTPPSPTPNPLPDSPAAPAAPAKRPRGFAALKASGRLAEIRALSSKGGKAAHAQGKAHKWTSEEAREAGRKGGFASHPKKLVGPDASR
jgi:general stress protein YciG